MTMRPWIRVALDDVETDALVTKQHADDLAEELTPAAVIAEGAAWDRGYEAAARCYWHKPRNPFTGEMNDDDPEDYCPSHGGTGDPMACNASPAPFNKPCPGA